MFICFFLFKQKTAYEMRISDWSSDVCSSDLVLQFIEFDRAKAGVVDVGRQRQRLVGGTDRASDETRHAGLFGNIVRLGPGDMGGGMVHVDDQMLGAIIGLADPVDRKSTRLNSSH